MLITVTGSSFSDIGAAHSIDVQSLAAVLKWQGDLILATIPARGTPFRT